MPKKIDIEINITELKKFLKENEGNLSFIETITLSIIQKTDEHPNAHLIRKYSEELEH